MRARNMQRLTDQLKARYPGVVIYGVGDDDHKRRPSAHNEDDTPGSLPDQQDADNVPEHRAIDVMVGPAFSRGQANEVVRDLVTYPANRARLTYVIFDGYIWSANNSPAWSRQPFTSDPHRDHPHVNGRASDDENGADWILGAATVPEHPEGDEDMKPILGRLLPASTVWKGYGVPGSLMALHDERAYSDVKGSLGAVELHYGKPHAGGAATLVDVLGTLPREEGETWAECHERSVAAVEDAG